MSSGIVTHQIATYSTVIGSSASPEFSDLPSGLARVRAKVKLGRRNSVSTEWKDIVIP